LSSSEGLILNLKKQKKYLQQCCGSVTFCYGTGSPAFSSLADKMSTKREVFDFLIFPVLLGGIFTSVFKDKKLKRSKKIVEIYVFLTFLLVDGSDK
jgi:hypothetical protein